MNSWNQVKTYIKSILRPGLTNGTNVQHLLDSFLTIINVLNGGSMDPENDAEWKPGITYAKDVEPVLWRDSWLVSNIANNVGIPPINDQGAVHPAWRVVNSSIGSGIRIWSPIVYPNVLEIVFYEGGLYYLDRNETGSGPFLSANFEEERALNQWVQLTGDHSLGDRPSFQEISSFAAASYREVIFTGRSFVMVSSSGLPITRSEDGYFWYNPPAPNIATWSIVDAEEVLIAAAETGTGSNCMRSTDDGKTWTQIATGVDATFRSIGYGRGVAVMAATEGELERVVFSSDKGLTWHPANVEDDLTFFPDGPDETFRHKLSYTGVVIGGGVVLLLANGAVIQRSTNGGSYFENVAISNGYWSKGIFFQGRFILFASGGTTSKIAYSEDLGLTWTTIASPEDLTTYTRPAIIGRWLYCGGSGGYLIRSKDGISWEVYNSGTTNNIQSIAAGRIRGVDMIIMVCDNGTNRFVRSIN